MQKIRYVFTKRKSELYMRYVYTANEIRTGQNKKKRIIIKDVVLISSILTGKEVSDMGRRRNEKVTKMKRHYSVSFGIFLCLFAIYILVLFIQSFTKEHVSIYEVSQKQIADNENLRGIIMREENLVTAEQAGYISYYVGEGAKLSVSTTVYSIAKKEPVTETVAEMETDDVTLSEEDTKNIRASIAGYRENFTLSNYQQISNFRYNIENTLLELSDVSLSKNLQKIKKENAGTEGFSLVKAVQTGIISFATDGYESLNIDDIDENTFKEMKDNWEQLRTDKKVKSGTPVYRIVTSEKWSLLVPLTKTQYQKIIKKDTIVVKIKKDNISMTPSVQAFTSEGKYYANLHFDKYMIHYLNNRYLDIELEFNNATGLKIPLSSILQKKCYVVPGDFITKGNTEKNRNKLGVVSVSYTEDGNSQINFTPVDIYYRDEENRYYIDTKVLPAGTTILKNGKVEGEQMQLAETKELDGVYNCNLGYCRFRYVNILYDNQGYAIVESGNTYSLSNYDHIILNPNKISDDEVIY